MYVQDFICEGYSASQFMAQFNDYLVEADEFNEEHKAKIANKLGVSIVTN